MKIILASQSPRRKELLRLLVDDFVIIPADIDETIQPADQPQEYVLKMAQQKALAISERYPEDLVIASDTIVANQGKILGKPVSRADAEQMLQAMSGGTHSVHTAVVLQRGTQKVEQIASAEVTFFELTTQEINHYLDQNEYQDKAGAYGIQGAAAVFVKEIKGDYYSIVGFPVGVVNQMLKTISF